MVKTFKALSLLLSYPTAEIQAAAADLKQALAREALVPAQLQGRLADLCDQLAKRDLIDLQERYVLLFDRTRSLSLHLFEHVHGQSRDRGQAMVDLMDLYARHGLTIAARELPDHLPLFLEFLSILPVDAARTHLAQIGHIVKAIAQRLDKRRSVYGAVFAALQALAAGRPSQGDLDALRDQPDDDPSDLMALDASWQDAPVTFGPPAAGMTAPGNACPAARATLALMDGGGAMRRSHDD
ncbi:MAG: nitrate reductase molybdenum cofactor assembly chaperone [Alphaproteobacteria bacterium]|nr:MAG: nitrate reductase molybdenum cofactor assembly chaperone [Alphaproteobacteria bacterium]